MAKKKTRKHFTQSFKIAVGRHAMRHGNEAAQKKYGVSGSSVGRWQALASKQPKKNRRMSQPEVEALIKVSPLRDENEMLRNLVIKLVLEREGA